MLSKKTQPNAAQKKWMALVMIYADYYGPVAFDSEWCENDSLECHHVVGRSYKHNKVHIGHWFILPLPCHLHSVNSNHPQNVTYYRKRFTERFGNQRDLWFQMITRMQENGHELPFGQDVIDAVMDTRY